MGPFRLWIQSVDPYARLFEILNQTNQIAHASDGEVIERPCRYLCHHRCQADRAAFRDKYAVDACALSRPQHCSQVVGIFNSVEEQEKGLLPSGLRLLKNFLSRAIGFSCDECDHALVMP